MMFAVVETSLGFVKKVWVKESEEEAINLAKQLCRENGIVYQGDVSMDGNVKIYSIQVVPL
jgi:hypothetical protein